MEIIEVMSSKEYIDEAMSFVGSFPVYSNSGKSFSYGFTFSKVTSCKLNWVDVVSHYKISDFSSLVLGDGTYPEYLTL